jgi:flagellar protein FlaG
MKFNAEIAGFSRNECHPSSIGALVFIEIEEGCADMIQISGKTKEQIQPTEPIASVVLERIQALKETKMTQEAGETANDPKKDFSKEELEALLEETNRSLQEEGKTHFQIAVHERTGRIMVNVVDNEPKEVIREVPPEKILDLVANIWEMVGIIVDERG